MKQEPCQIEVIGPSDFGVEYYCKVHDSRYHSRNGKEKICWKVSYENNKKKNERLCKRADAKRRQLLEAFKKN